MKKSVVLIVTNEDDPHVDYLMPMIEAEGVEYFRFNTETFPTLIDASIAITNKKIEGVIKDSFGRSLTLDQIVSVWYRRPMDARPDQGISAETSRDFVIKESREFTESLWFQIDSLWVNHPYKLRKASRKIQQLKVARQVGWEIPLTLVSNDIAEVRQFVEKNSEVVVKTLFNQFVVSGEEYKSFFTHALNSADGARLRDVKLCPCIFQETVRKTLELRITVIGNEVFAAALDTQKSPRAKDDWRRAANERIPCEEFKLPAEISEKSLAIVRAFDLYFASMDVILTPEGRYVFLDLNPNGQWLWVELETGMPMAEHFARLLANTKK
ncbi:MAG: hypothetical protein Q8P97_00425 [bacterium]|nr:hypothetical protein [bacterium]